MNDEICNLKKYIKNLYTMTMMKDANNHSAGNIKCDDWRRNLFNASICNIDSSRNCPDLAIMISMIVTSPLMKNVFLCVRFNSLRNAFIMA
ncbi:hypothetical protein DERF_011564 [Dermatophagoides farinae]|uniref:Uncharacterized protein n=1 Tax=Dermatophagoides farinae TaxID=6954 RepID=A0A922HXE3_DERFA|nr:hypothetical protein DERF_011564 [Dermatophagoides farinae]